MALRARRGELVVLLERAEEFAKVSSSTLLQGQHGEGDGDGRGAPERQDGGKAPGSATTPFRGRLLVQDPLA